ncbi:MAG TPA: toxin-antitoxin system HicB family antitoxin [Anaerolineae bacterium]|nr:toxin-antitoxin system HicB family antitoxin [Anaerolineae bacterium]
MSALSLRLPESLHAQVRELAERDKVSINQFVTLAVAEKVASLRTLDYIQQRAQRGSRQQFERVMTKIAEADLEPLAEDQLPES